VITRYGSFSSQADAEAHTCGILMAVLHTLKKRHMDVGAHLEGVLDQPAIDIHDAFPLLFSTGPTRDRRVTSQEEFSLTNVYLLYFRIF
jgi:hypothetical protein